MKDDVEDHIDDDADDKNIARGTTDPEIDSVTWQQHGTTYNSCKFGHKMEPLESLALPHCLGLPYWHYQLVLSLYLHQLELHQLSLHKALSFTQTQTHRLDPRDTWVR